MFGKRRLSQVGIALLLGGACACSGQKGSSRQMEFDSAGYEGFDETHFNLLTAVCTGTESIMNLTVGAGETAYIFKRASDGVVVANANTGGGAECTVTADGTIAVTGGAGAEKVIIDFYAGTFGLATTATPKIAIDLKAGDLDEVKFRGTPDKDVITLGSKDPSSYLAIAAGAAKARTFPDIKMDGVEKITVSAGAGNDTITAQGGAAVGNTATNVVGPLAGGITFTVYGGDGDDTINSGGLSDNTRNTLNGGAGNDLFVQEAALAADRINGGAGTDTVDYGKRTERVNVTLGTAAATVATATLSCALPSNISNNDYFTITDGTNSKMFAYNVTGDGVKATGYIDLPTLALIEDNDFFVLADGTNETATVFEYQKTADAPAVGTITVDEMADTHSVTVTDTSAASVTFIFAVSTTPDPAFVSDACDALEADEACVALTDPADAGAFLTALCGAIQAKTVGQTPALDLTVTCNDAENPLVITLTSKTNGGTLALTQSNAELTLDVTAGELFVKTDVNSQVIDVTAEDADVVALTVAKIDGVGATLAIDASDGSTQEHIRRVILTNDAEGEAGNQTVTISDAVNFAKANMAGGVDPFETNQTTAAATIIDISNALEAWTAVEVCAATAEEVLDVLGEGKTITITAEYDDDDEIVLTNDNPGDVDLVIVPQGADHITVEQVDGTDDDFDDGASGELDDIAADVENVVGGAGNDTIDATEASGVHVLMGMAGNDTLTGGPDTNFLYGGKGNDTLVGKLLIDYLYGGDDDDTLDGDKGDDSINGGGPNCFATASIPKTVSDPPVAATVPFAAMGCTSAIAPASTKTPGVDTIDYSARTSAVYVDLTQTGACTATALGQVDVDGEGTKECDAIARFGSGASAISSIKNIKGSTVNDTLKGDAQDNKIWGGAGNDTITCAAGNDTAYGGAGTDNISGDAGNDALYGGDGDDTVSGGDGNDYISGGLGANTLSGGDGLDTVDATQSTGLVAGTKDTVSCGAGDGDIYLGSGTAPADCEP